VGSKRVVLERAERVADGARANLSDVEARYEQGFVGPLEMLDAQNVEAEARVAVIEARRELELAKVRLLHCTAELLESVPELARPGARPRS
jgi:outer membrane protein TolC